VDIAIKFVMIRIKCVILVGKMYLKIMTRAQILIHVGISATIINAMIAGILAHHQWMILGQIHGWTHGLTHVDIAIKCVMIQIICAILVGKMHLKIKTGAQTQILVLISVTIINVMIAGILAQHQWMILG
jgi:hypothetical protein